MWNVFGSEYIWATKIYIVVVEGVLSTNVYHNSLMITRLVGEMCQRLDTQRWY